MTKRHYQLFALLLLIGAPLVVSLLTSSLMPGLRQIAPSKQEPQRPDYMQPAPDPAAGLPPAQQEPPPSQVVQSGPQAGASYTPVAVLDPAGVTLTGTDPTPAAAAADPTGSVDSRREGAGGAGGPSEEDLIARSAKP